MSKHLVRDIERLERRILTVGSMVERATSLALEALNERKVDLAVQVIEGDRELDVAEVEIEEECLKTLALEQPVADDLRFIAAVIKINNDLERMGDLAVNIAERARFVTNNSALPVPARLRAMGEATMRMVRESLDAFVNRDAEAAQRVRDADDVVDDYNRLIARELQQFMIDNPHEIAPSMNLFSACRNLERIADHATNIAEDVIYLVSGTIVRHGGEPSP